MHKEMNALVLQTEVLSVSSVLILSHLEPCFSVYWQYILTFISIARQRVAKHILAATNTQATIEELPFLFNRNLNTSL
jgi:hypothetical protein